MTERNQIDRATLVTLYGEIGSDPAFFAELLTTFFEDTSQLLSDMDAAIEAHDSGEVRRLAHSLKSNSASFGATSLSRLCRELEERAAHGNLDGANVLRTRIATEYSEVKAALQDVIDTGLEV